MVSNFKAIFDILSEEQILESTKNTACYRKIAANLMSTVFSEEELETSSVNGHCTSKPRLPEKKVQAIIGFVAHRSRATPTEINVISRDLTITGTGLTQNTT